MTEISSLQELQKFKLRNNVFVAFLVDDDRSWELDYYRQLLQLVDDIPCYYIANEQLKMKLGYHERTGVIVFKNYDEGRVDFPFET